MRVPYIVSCDLSLVITAFCEDEISLPSGHRLADLLAFISPAREAQQ